MQRGLPRIDSVSHIVPLHIGEASLCMDVSQRLLNEFGMYATPINYPTVPRGEERLRFTPGPLHTDAMMDQLVRGVDRDHTDGAPPSGVMGRAAAGYRQPEGRAWTCPWHTNRDH